MIQTFMVQVKGRKFVNHTPVTTSTLQRISGEKLFVVFLFVTHCQFLFLFCFRLGKR